MNSAQNPFRQEFKYFEAFYICKDILSMNLWKEDSDKIRTLLQIAENIE